MSVASTGLLQGSLGDSLFGGLTVGQRIIASLPVTIQLGLIALVLGQLIALPVGIYSAIRQDTPADYAGRTIAVIGMATPNFWLGIMVMIFPSIWWGWAPPMQYTSLMEDPLGNLGFLIIPSVILGDGAVRRHDADDADHDAGGAAPGLYQDCPVEGPRGAGDYHAARGQECPHPDGYPGRHAVAYPGGWARLSWRPSSTCPGLGGLLVNALTERDYPMVSGVNLVFATVVLLSNLFIDLLYPYLDPRVRYR